MRKSAKYENAIEWIASEDDTEWLNDEDPSPSVTACLVADIFGTTIEQVTRDLRKAVKQREDRASHQADAVAFTMTASSPPPKVTPWPCSAFRQGDEMFCPTCGIRWGSDEQKPDSAECV